MKVEQIYTGCLAEAAYYIESNGEAVVIDPLRETQPYVEKAEKDGAKIKYVLETHFHADFVSGHLDLAKKTGAQIVFGPTAKPEFECHVAADGEELKVGNVIIKVLHTPGHTMESTTYLLLDENGKENAIFTGDTLFIGDVGRPDLAIKSDLTMEDLAGHLYDSIRTKIMPLLDEVIVYPGHGAGSACGKKMSTETHATLGNQKMFNYALRSDMSKEEFIMEVTDGLVTPPQYFPKNAVMNKTGYESLDTVLERGVVALDPDEFEDVVNRNNALVLDTRSDENVISDGFIPNSVFIGIDGNFASWVGTLVPDMEMPILFVADEGRENEVVTRLARVGYDSALGYLKGGFKAWVDASKEVDAVKRMSVEEFAGLYTSSSEPVNILDVRRASEYNAEHVEGAVNTPLDFINDHLDKIDKDKTYYVHCQSGYREMIFNTILRSRGYNNLIGINEGFNGIKATTKIPVTEFVEQDSML